jgi:hypothetical protein
MGPDNLIQFPVRQPQPLAGVPMYCQTCGVERTLTATEPSTACTACGGCVFQSWPLGRRSGPGWEIRLS